MSHDGQDHPISLPSSDTLGFDALARHTAERIDRLHHYPSTVTGIMGPWGSGKTSLLNLVVHHLSRSDTRPAFRFIHLHPWWFDSGVPIVTMFYEELARHLTSTIPWRRRSGRIARQLANVLSTGRDIPQVGPILSIAVHPLNAVGNILTDGPPTVQELHHRLDRDLSRHHYRYLVIMDDLDRMPIGEVLSLFGVIRSSASLSRIHYVIAFDDIRIADQITSHYSLPGLDYLSKFITHPIRIPKSITNSVAASFIDYVSPLVSLISKPTLGTRDTLVQFYNAYMSYSIINHRSAKRVAQSFVSTYTLTGAELHPGDYALISAIRTLYPKTYQYISDHPHLFSGRTQDGARYNYPYMENDPHDLWLERLDAELSTHLGEYALSDRLRLYALLRGLSPLVRLPNLTKPYSSIEYSGSLDDGESDRRFAHYEYTSSYLASSLPDSLVSYEHIYKVVHDPLDSLGTEHLASTLVTLSDRIQPDGNPYVRALYQRCIPAIYESTDLHRMDMLASAMLQVFGSQWDMVQSSEILYAGELPFETLVAVILSIVIRKHEPEDRLYAAKRFMSTYDLSTLLIASELCIIFCEEHGFGDDSRRSYAQDSTLREHEAVEFISECVTIISGNVRAQSRDIVGHFEIASNLSKIHESGRFPVGLTLLEVASVAPAEYLLDAYRSIHRLARKSGMPSKSFASQVILPLGHHWIDVLSAAEASEEPEPPCQFAQAFQWWKEVTDLTDGD